MKEWQQVYQGLQIVELLLIKNNILPWKRSKLQEQHNLNEQTAHFSNTSAKLSFVTIAKVLTVLLWFTSQEKQTSVGGCTIKVSDKHSKL